MPDLHKQRAKAARAKMKETWVVPGYVCVGGPHDYTFDCPFREQDREDWFWLIAEALGTRNRSVIKYSLDALSALCANRWNGPEEAWEVVPHELNTALAIMAACEVENEAQAAIAMQMVGLHFSGMKMAAQSGRYSWRADERSAATQARIARTMASLQETLARLQGRLKPRAVNQTIQVIYLDQRQQTAVVGGEGISGGQGQTAKVNNGYSIDGAAIPSGCAALPSPCPDNGATVPLPRRERQASVPDAWWWQRLWSAVRRT